jgi:hypothetical protein
MYIQFVEVVAEVRKLDFHEAKSFSGVRAYAGEDIETDRWTMPGTLEVAVKTTAEMAISCEPPLVHPPRAASLLDWSSAIS